MKETITEKKVRDIKAVEFHEVSRPLLEKTCNFRYRVDFDHAFCGIPKRTIVFRKVPFFATIFDVMQRLERKKSKT